MDALEAEVERKLAATWLGESDRTEARAVLLEYGTQAYHRERERVRLAIIMLSGGSLEELRRMTSAAQTDYRDVLMWAEHPEEGRALWSLRRDLSPAERQELASIRARDRKQYEGWRRG
jgi:hypothetical protein